MYEFLEQIRIFPLKPGGDLLGFRLISHDLLQYGSEFGRGLVSRPSARPARGSPDTATGLVSRLHPLGLLAGHFQELLVGGG